MISYILDQLDSFAKYLDDLSFMSILNTYWFLFFIEFPRYYLMEVVISLYHGLTIKRRFREQSIARQRLFAESPLVTVLAPGKNEGSHIYSLTRTLAEQTYKNVEIIVVDDGSDDLTKLICTNLQRRGLIHLYLRESPGGGKASAANFGARYARGKYLIHLDADSSLDYDAIEKILLPFYLDPRVKGVGGTIKVRNNQHNVCTSLQALEYLKTIQVGRMVADNLGFYHIISGAFGAFDTDTLRHIGYWDIGPGLDGDITQKIRKGGWKVAFADNAICMTSVPTSWFKLFKQRYRWSKSLVRFRIRKHFDILVPNRNWNILNWLSNMEGLFYDCFLNYLWLFYIITLMINHNNHILEIFVLGWFLRFCFSIVAFSVIMMVTERKREELFLFKYLPLVTFYTGYYLRLTRLLAHTMEFFFFSSYRDKWNPRKTSIFAQIEGI